MEALSLREDVARSMKPGEIAEAARLARELRAVATGQPGH